MRTYSLAEARDNLTAIVRDVEKITAVELTRRGKAVAVIVSIDEYNRLTRSAGSFSTALERFRQQVDLTDMALGPEIFEEVRETDPGREPAW
jgi:prevent-host-death family protein